MIQLTSQDLEDVGGVFVGLVVLAPLHILAQGDLVKLLDNMRHDLVILKPIPRQLILNDVMK